MITFSRIGQYGRIGNQMFQYAALVGVSIKTGFDYGVDISKCNLGEIFELDIKPFKGNIENQYKEPYFYFCENVFSIQDNTDILGYFQSYKYFEHCYREILKQFLFKKKYQIKIEQYGTDFTSIHVRRGDYVGTGRYYNCDINYYNKACKVIGDSRYIIFSDNIPWCKNNFKDSKFEIMEDLNIYESFCLMAKARNNIIANSSFSWWASYLNQNPEKKIVAPTKWFDKLQRNAKDLYMSNWILV